MQQQGHDPRAGPQDLVPRSASVVAGHPDAVRALARALGPGPFALILLFASSQADLPRLIGTAAHVFSGTRIAGCSTVGEVTAGGYHTGQIVAFAFPAQGFAAELLAIEHIDRLNTRDIVSQVLTARQSLGRRAEHYPQELALLLVDGFSGHEEVLIAALTGGLGHVPMIGGSAGDPDQFANSSVFAHGRVMKNAAVLCLLRSRCPFRSFSIDNTRPSLERMIVTAALPEKRIVTRINDEPAALEYARLLNRPVDQLSDNVFAMHPVLVRAGGRHHVRAIRSALPDHSLIFFGAVAEGMILTIAYSENIAEHLSGNLTQLASPIAPSITLGFDCFFRRVDAEGRQQGAEVSRILDAHRVVGFSSFGEQFGGLHVNQTLSGIAFYPSESLP